MQLLSKCLLFLAATLTAVNALDGCENCSRGPFMNPTETEECDFVCPDLSESLTGIYCPRDFRDCKCDFGAKRDGKACICVSAFTCPPNSQARHGCPVSMHHCVCAPGYKKIGDECVCVERDCMEELPPCDFECPFKSRLPGMECPTSFEDCECEFGYAKDGDQCVCDSVCPENSIQIEGNPCPRNHCRHCECIEGYEMFPEGCLPVCEYLCPAGSRPKEGLRCAESFKDCECAPGLIEVGGQSCECTLKCPENSTPNDGIDCPISTESDCTCNFGYIMVDGVCTETDTGVCKEPVPDTPCFDCGENAFLINEKYPTPNCACYGTFEADCFCDTGFKPVLGRCTKQDAKEV